VDLTGNPIPNISELTSKAPPILKIEFREKKKRN